MPILRRGGFAIETLTRSCVIEETGRAVRLSVRQFSLFSALLDAGKPLGSAEARARGNYMRSSMAHILPVTDANRKQTFIRNVAVDVHGVNAKFGSDGPVIRKLNTRGSSAMIELIKRKK